MYAAAFNLDLSAVSRKHRGCETRVATGPIERRVRECVPPRCRYTVERVPSDVQMRKYYRRTGEKKEKKATGSRTWVNSFEWYQEGMREHECARVAIVLSHNSGSVSPEYVGFFSSLDRGHLQFHLIIP